MISRSTDNITGAGQHAVAALAGHLQENYINLIQIQVFDKDFELRQLNLYLHLALLLRSYNLSTHLPPSKHTILVWAIEYWIHISKRFDVTYTIAQMIFTIKRGRFSKPMGEIIDFQELARSEIL
ncbi:hypothetical protein ACJX0J_020269 [Zea mays]